MSEIKIAKTLKQAVGMGPAHVADLIRQKLTLLQFHLEEGVVPKDAIQAFMQNLGMDEIKMSLETGLETEHECDENGKEDISVCSDCSEYSSFCSQCGMSSCCGTGAYDTDYGSGYED